MEGYINMVIRSTTNNVTNGMQLERFKEHGIDLIEVSSHIDARPKYRIC
ncbi:phage minor capsid protein [Lysinibacillus xylanilyticus]|nr:phage minor capsid protein [Lysinibacillus xylanilyticus]